MLTNGNSYEVDVDGESLFLADGDEAVRLVDVGTPSSPAEILHFDAAGRSAEVGIDGSNIVVANFAKTTNGFRVLDAVNPANVEEIGRFVVTGTTPDVAVNDGQVYLGEQAPNYGLTIAEIQDPQSPALVSHLGFGNPPTRLDVANGRAYLTFDDRMRIVDVQDPEAPSVLGTFVAGSAFDALLFSVTVAGTTAYLTDFVFHGIRIVNVANPAYPNQIGTYQIPGTVYDVAVAGSTAYLATSDALMVVDVSTPSSPTLVSSLPLPSECFGVLLSGSTAYVCAGPAGVFAVDISEPTAPVISGQYDTDRAVAACLYYDYVVVADVSNGIYVFADDKVVSTPSIMAATGIRAYPNPFNPSTTVSFSVPTSAVVSLQVFDVAGAFVRTLASGRYSAGVHTVSWDGRDDVGNADASGVYFCRLRAGNDTVTHKLVLLK